MKKNMKRLGAAMVLFPEETREYALAQCRCELIDEKIKQAEQKGICDNSLIEERRQAKETMTKILYSLDEKLQKEAGISFII